MFHLIHIIIYYIALKSTETFTIQKDHIFARGQKLRHNGGVLRARDKGFMARITTHTNIVTDLETETKYFMTTLLYK